MRSGEGPATATSAQKTWQRMHAKTWLKTAIKLTSIDVVEWPFFLNFHVHCIYIYIRGICIKVPNKQYKLTEAILLRTSTNNVPGHAPAKGGGLVSKPTCATVATMRALKTTNIDTNGSELTLIQTVTGYFLKNIKTPLKIANHPSFISK